MSVRGNRYHQRGVGVTYEQGESLLELGNLLFGEGVGLPRGVSGWNQGYMVLEMDDDVLLAVCLFGKRDN